MTRGLFQQSKMWRAAPSMAIVKIGWDRVGYAEAEAFAERDGPLRDQVSRGACEDDGRRGDSERPQDWNCEPVPEG
jgi:hypothetical protein